MDLKRYFRGPFVAVLVMLLLFFIVFAYANHGDTYTPAIDVPGYHRHLRGRRQARPP